jgi:hypothetical protein
MAGASYNDIIRANIGYKSHGHLSKDLKKALKEFQQTYEQTADLAILDLARVDDIQRRVTMAFHSGDTAQAGMLLRIIAFRREIIGITPEDARNDRQNASTLVNQGIMVVQGSAEDYLKSMMQAAGASPEEQKTELERVAASNRAAGRNAPTEVIDAEVVEETEEKPRKTAPRKKLRRTNKSTKTTTVDDQISGLESEDPTDSEVLEKSLLQLEQNDNSVEKLPSLQLSDPLLSIDFPDENEPRKKRLRIKVKRNDTNMNDSPGTPYRSRPRKPSTEVSEKRLLSKGARATSSGPNRHDVFPGSTDSTLLYDELEAETLTQNID